MPQDHVQTLIGTVGPLGYSEHTISLPRGGRATVALAWQAPAANLILHVLRPAYSAMPVPQHPLIAFSGKPSGTLREVSFEIAPREAFEVMVDSEANRTLAYTITVSLA